LRNPNIYIIFADKLKYEYVEYLNRTADVMLKDLLDAFGAVLIEGPKWCGKTTTAEQAAKSATKWSKTR